MLANSHSILASELCCACLYDTHDVRLPTQFRFNVGPVLQTIAGSMPTNCLRRWFNTTPTLDMVCTWQQYPSNHVSFTCQYPILKQHWVIVPCLLGLLCGPHFASTVAKKVIILFFSALFKHTAT